MIMVVMIKSLNLPIQKYLPILIGLGAIGLIIWGWLDNKLGLYHEEVLAINRRNPVQIKMFKRFDDLEDQERYKPKETIPSQEWKQYTEAQRNEKTYLLNILFELFENIKIIYNPNKKGRKFYKIQDVICSLILKTYTKLKKYQYLEDRLN